ncbi:hypothetical protein QCA50_006981 [Cerrena zonata]|uniref:Pentatricopeptide repeat protein n=1 Tax=Cerrena zonata TaxID=2478898 RepID=A0AAW0GL13_9APHY
MFICRRCLLRAHAPKLLPTPIFLRRFNHRPNIIESLYIQPEKPPLDERETEDTSHDRVVQHAHSNVIGEVPGKDGTKPSTWYIHITDEEKNARKKKYFPWRYHPITSYIQQYNNDPDALVDMPFYAFRWVIKDALKQGRSDILNYVTMDVVKRYVGRSHWERLWVLGKLLKSTRQGNTTLPRSKLLLIVETLHNEGHLPIMTPHVIGFTAKAVLRYPENPHFDRKLVKLLTPCLLEEADKLRTGIIKSNTGTLVRHLIWPLFGFVQRLLSIGDKDEALALFQTLIEKKYVSELAMQDIDLSSKDVTYIMVGTMVKACLQHNWHLQARTLLRQVLDSDDTIHPFLIGQLHELIRWSLSRNFDSDFRYVTSVLSTLLSTSHTPMIPDELLAIYYKRAKVRNAGAEAERVYALTTSPEVMNKHVYPPPSGPGLLWFLEYSIFTSKNFGVARTLANRVVKEDLPVPVHDKALIVAAIASVGWASHARDLWERFSAQPGARLVFGNAQSMLRIVSLFNSLIRTGEKRLETLRNMTDEERRALSRTIENHGPPRVAASDERDVDEAEDVEELTDLTEDIPEDEISDFEVPFVPKRHGVSEPPLDETPPVKETVERWEARLQDFRAFTEHVIQQFASLRQPLKKANHHDLNALARAYFIVGRFGEGFRMFKTILARREIPDMSDVNVALSAMARQNPTQAAKMIERMVAHGLQPDAVSFGTIIHHAIVDRNMILVSELITRARQLGVKELSYKTMGSLIRATVSTLYEDEDAPEQQMEKAKDLVDSLLDAGFTPSIRMGLDCIIAALRADDPCMAFRFWKLLLKDKTQWDDKQQVRVRCRIAKALRLHRTKRWLNDEFANIMLSELGEDPSPHVVIRRRRRSAASRETDASNLDPGRPPRKEDSNESAQSSSLEEPNTTKSTGA